MRYTQPEYSIQVVNQAGRRLVESLSDRTIDLAESQAVIDNWRASHAYPAQIFFLTLKRKARLVHKNALVAQRIKRLPSIADKLDRERDMKLSQMQDIGGCRAVLPTVDLVNELRVELEKVRWKHAKLSPKDYITSPKVSGYRGIHLKYRFEGSGQKSHYNGLKVELQLRTTLQHRWATAVEAADTFSKQALKSSRGSKEWQRFFALMSSVFALREALPLVPGTPSTFDELVAEIKDLNSRYHFAQMFAGYAAILPRVEKGRDAVYYLVTLDPVNMTAEIKGFKKEEAQLAHREYSTAEKALEPGSPQQIVLVSVSSVNALKRVYPNYFLDTTEFTREVWWIVDGLPQGARVV